MPRSTKKGPSVRSLTRQINALRDMNYELAGRVYGSVKVQDGQSIRQETPADNAVTGAVRAAQNLGFKVYVTLDYKGGLNYVATKHERA